MARRRERPGKDAPEEAVIERNHAIDWSTVFHGGANGEPATGDEAVANAVHATTSTGEHQSATEATVPDGAAHDWSSVLRSDLAGSQQSQSQPEPAAVAQSVRPQASPPPPTDLPTTAPPTPEQTTSSWMANMRSMLAPAGSEAEQFFEDSLDLESPEPVPAPADRSERPSIFEEVVSSPRDSDSVFTSPESDLELFGASHTADSEAAADEPVLADAEAAILEHEDIEDVSLGPTGIFGGPSGWFDALLDAEATNDLDRRSRALSAEADSTEEPSRSFLDIVGGNGSTHPEAPSQSPDHGDAPDTSVTDTSADRGNAGTDSTETDEDPQRLTEAPIEALADRYGRLELRRPADDIELLMIITEPIGAFGSPPVRCEVELCPPGTQLDVLKLHYDTTLWSPEDADVVWDYVSGWLPKIWVTLAGKRRIAGTVVETWIAYKDDMMPGEQHLRTTATLDDALDFESFTRIQRDAIEDRTGGRWFDAVEVQSDL